MRYLPRRLTSTSFPAIFLLILTAAFFGGSSREDVLSAVLVPLAAIALAFYLLVRAKPDTGRRDGAASAVVPLCFAISFPIIALLQLVPLHTGIWTLLPGREHLTVVDALLRHPHSWRPMSLAPDATLRFAIAGLVPVAAVMAMTDLKESAHNRILWVLILLACVSALLAVLQVAAGSSGQFQMYAQTTPGSANGLFANRNHQAVFLAAMMPFAVLALQGERALRLSTRGRAIGVFVALMFVALLLLMNGSRAGLLCGVIGLGGSVAVYATGQQPGQSIGRAAWAAAATLVVLASLGIAALAAAGRLETVNHLQAGELGTDLRFAFYPTFGKMIRAYMPIGSGFGSFEAAFKRFEPFEFLGPTYLNAAHNDYVQLVIEGGIVAAALIVAYVVVMAFASWQCWSAPRSSASQRGKAASVALLTILVASWFDYPLRTPLLLCVFAILSMWVWNGRAHAVGRGAAR